MGQVGRGAGGDKTPHSSLLASALFEESPGLTTSDTRLKKLENCCRFGNLIQIGVLQVATVDQGCSIANPHLDRFKPNQALAVC